ncbi:hypothetical protein QTP88_005123 [Uroleucon formosanum]
MATEENGLLYNKARSASICAFGFPPGSTEYLLACAKAAASTPPPHRHIGGAAAIAAAEDNKRRRPAVRSQSARTSGGRSIRKKALVAAAVGAQHGQHLSDSRSSVRSGYSDPRLHESSPQEAKNYQKHMSRRSRAYFIGLMSIIPLGGKKTVSRKNMTIICQRKYAFCQIPILFVKTPVAPHI